jgi:Tfp pilus assembly protein PilF
MEAHFTLAHCFTRIGDRKSALESFRNAVRCKPDSSEAHRCLGESLAEEGQIGESLVHLEHAVDLNPADLVAQRLLQQTKAKRKRDPVPD